MRPRLRAKRVRALLGPTNTGKTHRAIEAMLRRKNGIFGLPLRLLAREVYDRVVARTAPDQVALVTGEEKIIPRQARFWICTVEAMPTDRPVAFVAIDEVQLAADRQRGHVFTERILHARGLEETVFMGSDRIRGLLTELVPEVEIEEAARFSALTYLGQTSIGGMPRRAAVVAFSAEQVYALAERLKGAHGGVAVVLGALSPRTRNAQVELYQSGRVEHLVATDAIGMGLNLDLQHVTLAATRKFDGRQFRDLIPPEVGQIAGRAGRYKQDGTFGALRPIELDAELVQAVEQHRYRPIRRIFWRNTDLDYDDVDALLRSLEREPSNPAFIQVRNLDDQHALTVLGRDRGIQDRLTGPEAVERLWEVCRVPDFRKTLTDAHLRLLHDLAVHRLGRGTLPESWVADRIGRLERTDGDIETLMSRLAWIRTWTYVAWRPGWLDDHQHWRERSRAIEDRLSDALHEALTARFVDRFRGRHGATSTATIDDDGFVHLDGVKVGRLVGLELRADGKVRGEVWSRVKPLIDARVAKLLAGEGELEITDTHAITWDGFAVADLVRGPHLLEPKVKLRRLELLRGADKDQLRVLLDRWVRGRVETLFAGMRRGKAKGPLKGIHHAIRTGMGTVRVDQVRGQLRQLDDAGRKQLARGGIRVGRHLMYLPRSLKPDAARLRALLWGIFHGEQPGLPDLSATAHRAVHDERFHEALGFPVYQGVAVRADVLETIAAELRRVARHGPFELPESVVARVALGRDASAAVVRGLGYPEAGEYFLPAEGRTGRR